MIFKLRSYTKEELEGKELVNIHVDTLFGNGNYTAKPLHVEKFSNKVIVLKGGGRIPYHEVGSYKKYSRFVCPKEDVEEIFKMYQEVAVVNLEMQVDTLNKRIEDTKNAKLTIVGEEK